MKRVKLINYILSFDPYLNQIVGLALKGKIGMPDNYRPPELNEERHFGKKVKQHIEDKFKQEPDLLIEEP